MNLMPAEIPGETWSPRIRTASFTARGCGVLPVIPGSVSEPARAAVPPT